MIIHLVGSMRKFNEDLPIFRRITKVIHDSHHSLAVNWFESVEVRSQIATWKEGTLHWPEVIDQNIEAVKRADLVIIEGSRYYFAQGFQTAVALQFNKPVLNLYKKDVEEYGWPDKLYVSGVSNKLFTSKSYTDQNLEKIIKKFLKDNAVDKKFNITISLDKTAHSALTEFSFRSDKDEGQIVKDIVYDGINKLSPKGIDKLDK